jgi:uncharacterized protein
MRRRAIRPSCSSKFIGPVPLKPSPATVVEVGVRGERGDERVRVSAVGRLDEGPDRNRQVVLSHRQLTSCAGKAAGRWNLDTSDMRISIRVRPGSARPGVGGEHAGALIVRVSARAVDGKATEAALAAVAEAFGVRRGAVRLVSGASSRTKIVDVDADDPRILAALLAARHAPSGY